MNGFSLMNDVEPWGEINNPVLGGGPGSVRIMSKLKRRCPTQEGAPSLYSQAASRFLLWKDHAPEYLPRNVEVECAANPQRAKITVTPAIRLIVGSDSTRVSPLGLDRFEVQIGPDRRWRR